MPIIVAAAPIAASAAATGARAAFGAFLGWSASKGAFLTVIRWTLALVGIQAAVGFVQGGGAFNAGKAAAKASGSVANMDGLIIAGAAVAIAVYLSSR